MFRKKSHSETWFVCASWPVVEGAGGVVGYVCVHLGRWLCSGGFLLGLCFCMGVCWLLEP